MRFRRPLIALARLHPLSSPGLAVVPQSTSRTIISASPSSSSSPPASNQTRKVPQGSKARGRQLPRAFKVPPESPFWTPLKTLPFSEEVEKPRRRGFVPVPREPWLKHEGSRRITEAYFEETVPKPKPENLKKVPPQPGSRRHWKAKMADERRRNLRSGLRALWQRRTETAESNRQVSQARRRRNVTVMRSIQAIDNDRLTTPTVLAATALDTKVYPDPDRFRIAQSKRSHLMYREEAKRDSRRAAILNLYHRAGTFIVTESELKVHVESIFTEDYFSSQGGDARSVRNVWQLYGPPPGITDMRGWGSGDNRDSQDARIQTLNQHRLWALGQEMTGGRRAT